MVLGPAAFFTQLWDFPLLLPKAPQFDKMSNFVQFLNSYQDIPCGILMLTNYLKLWWVQNQSPKMKCTVRLILILIPIVVFNFVCSEKIWDIYLSILPFWWFLTPNSIGFIILSTTYLLSTCQIFSNIWS